MIQYNKKCTVLMCTYNAEKYIVEQLDSLRKQTYKNICVVIYDDNSRDNTVTIIRNYIRKYDSEIEIVLNVNKCNSGGPSENFKHITSDHSDEQYICYCDQDDIWDANKIQIMMDKMIHLEATKQAPYIVCHNCAVTDENANVVHHGSIKNLSFKHLIYHPEVQGCCMMLNHDAINRLNIENAIICMHDWYACLVVAACGEIALIDSELIKYRQHSNNQVGYSKRSLFKSIKEALKLNNKCEKYYVMMEQLYSVSKVISENEFLRNFRILFEEERYLSIVLLFFKEKVLELNTHGVYQGAITYLACKRRDKKR
ncbi:glycosyltransferase [Blautia sp. HCP3S3_G3]|uniref:glycosyltransferase n=1 Tax=Blautia sp. HCP3S3_G3 TaxID=3438913 RepID=UPI003F8A0C04